MGTAAPEHLGSPGPAQRITLRGQAGAALWGHNGVLCVSQGRYNAPWRGTLGYCPGWGEQQQLQLAALSSPGCLCPAPRAFVAPPSCSVVLGSLRPALSTQPSRWVLVPACWGVRGRASKRLASGDGDGTTGGVLGVHGARWWPRRQRSAGGRCWSSAFIAGDRMGAGLRPRCVRPCRSGRVMGTGTGTCVVEEGWGEG